MKTKSNIVIDIGNSRIKYGEILGVNVGSIETYGSIEELLTKFPRGRKSIVCSVNHSLAELKNTFKNYNTLVFSHDTPIPISLNYRIP